MTNSQLLERRTKILSKYCIKREKHQKVNFEKLNTKGYLTSFQNPQGQSVLQLLHVCPPVPSSIVFAVLLIPSFNVLSIFLNVSNNLMVGLTVRIFIKFVT